VKKKYIRKGKTVRVERFSGRLRVRQLQTLQEGSRGEIGGEGDPQGREKDFNQKEKVSTSLR